MADMGLTEVPCLCLGHEILYRNYQNGALGPITSTVHVPGVSHAR